MNQTLFQILFILFLLISCSGNPGSLTWEELKLLNRLENLSKECSADMLRTSEASQNTPKIKPVLTRTPAEYFIQVYESTNELSEIIEKFETHKVLDGHSQKQAKKHFEDIVDLLNRTEREFKITKKISMDDVMRFCMVLRELVILLKKDQTFFE